MQTKIILALIEADKELKKVHAGLDLGTAIEAVMEVFEKENKILTTGDTFTVPINTGTNPSFTLGGITNTPHTYSTAETALGNDQIRLS